MATSKRPSRRSASARLVLSGAVALAILVGGCGSAGPKSSSSPPAAGTGSAVAAPQRGGAAGFAWLVPGGPPPGWHAVRIPTGATMFYPPGWRTMRGDRGTATAVLLDAAGRYAGYLNVTPRQGGERLANWVTFRPRHNRAEGDTAVRPEAAARRLRFRAGQGSCVRDAYTTKTGIRYVEIACIVQGARTATVIVAAAPPAAWARERGVLQQAIAAFQA